MSPWNLLLRNEWNDIRRECSLTLAGNHLTLRSGLFWGTAWGWDWVSKRASPECAARSCMPAKTEIEVLHHLSWPGLLGLVVRAFGNAGSQLNTGCSRFESHHSRKRKRVGKGRKEVRCLHGGGEGAEKGMRWQEYDADYMILSKRFPQILACTILSCIL